jgi:thioredoxin 1
MEPLARPATRSKNAVAAVAHATDETFEELVLLSARPVIVDFWATWCPPCRKVAPELEKLAAKYEGVVDVVKVDVDANPKLSAIFGIHSIPTIAFFREGEQPIGILGFMPMEQIESAFGLADLVDRPADTAENPAEPAAEAPVSGV